MKIKNIKIAVKSHPELFEEVKDVWGKIEEGKAVKKHEAIYFENLKAMRRVLTEERLRVLKTIKQNQPSSVYELAKILQRDVKNTFNDVQFLARVGLIELKKSKQGREKTTPVVRYNRIRLEIAV